MSPKLKKQIGFGLIELMVSVSILAIVFGIVLTRQTAFNGAVLLRSQAYEIALALREVQMSSVNAGGLAGEYRYSRGIFFDNSSLADNQYQPFQDNDGDYFYDLGEDFGPTYFLDDKFEVREFNVYGDTMTGSQLSVVFQRPNFDAIFYDDSGRLNASRVEVVVSVRGETGSDVGDIKLIEITSTGQIDVK